MRERRLSEEQWRAAIEQGKPAKELHREISYAVLVKGRAQKDVGAQHQLSAGAVSQIIGRVWRAHLSLTTGLREGWREVTVKLPEREATLVEALARLAAAPPESR